MIPPSPPGYAADRPDPAPRRHPPPVTLAPRATIHGTLSSWIYWITSPRSGTNGGGIAFCLADFVAQQPADTLQRADDWRERAVRKDARARKRRGREDSRGNGPQVLRQNRPS